MLWELQRTVSMRRFFWASKTGVGTPKNRLNVYLTQTRGQAEYNIYS